MKKQKENERKTIKKCLKNLTDYGCFEGSLDGVIGHLESFKKEYPNYFDFSIHSEYCFDDGIIFELWGERYETDEEMESRINKSKKAKEAAKKKETKEN